MTSIHNEYQPLFESIKTTCPLLFQKNHHNDSSNKPASDIETMKANYNTFITKISNQPFVPWKTFNFEKETLSLAQRSRADQVYVNCILDYLIVEAKNITTIEVTPNKKKTPVNLLNIVKNIRTQIQHKKDTEALNITINDTFEPLRKVLEVLRIENETFAKKEVDLTLNKKLKCSKVCSPAPIDIDALDACVKYYDIVQELKNTDNVKILRRYPNIYVLLENLKPDKTECNSVVNLQEKTFASISVILGRKEEITTIQHIVDILKQREEAIKQYREKRKDYWLDSTGDVQVSKKSYTVSSGGDTTIKQGDTKFKKFIVDSQYNVQNNSRVTEFPCDNEELKPHQYMVKNMLSRKSPVHRLLVHHRVGSGKTRTAIEVLDNYYDDPRTKIVICPSEPLCQQFIKELLEGTPNKYQEWARQFKPKDVYESYKIGLKCTSTGNPPAKFISVQDTTFPAHFIQFQETDNRTLLNFSPGPLVVVPIYKVEYILEQENIAQFKSGSELEMTAHFRRGMLNNNPMSGKIIIFDEFHTLFEPTTHDRILLGTNKRITREVDYKLLKHHLHTMKGSLLAAFTATPPPENRMNDMVPVLTGDSKRTTLSDLEGYVHCYLGNDAVFPTVDPIESLYRPVEINTNEQLDVGICKLSSTNVHVHKEMYRNITCPPRSIKKDETIRNTILKDLPKYAPKIAEMLNVLETYKNKGQNILILCSENTGIDLIEEIFRDKHYGYIRISPKRSTIYNMNNSGKQKTTNDFSHAIKQWDKECKKAIDRNPIQIIMIDTTKLAEGLNVKGVSIMLGLSSYMNAESMEQAFGRADRMCTRNQFRNKNIPNKLERIHFVAKVDENEYNTTAYKNWKQMETYKNKFKHLSF